MFSRLRGRAVPVLLAAFAIVAASCYAPTQITVDVTTDTACDGTSGTTAITAGPRGGVEGAAASAESGPCRQRSFGSLVVVPSGDRDERVTIKVVTGVGKPASQCAPPGYAGCIVARRSLAFIKHARLRVPIVMSAACVGKPCSDETTCVEGACINAFVDDATACAGDGCTEDILFPNHLRPDGGTAVDAGGPDASDAHVADAADAGGDAAHDAGVVCGTESCASNEYCIQSSGGAQMPDGGSSTSYSCDVVPAACMGNPRCKCLVVPPFCMCSESSGSPVVTCFNP